jgi:hypothetical protein
MGLGLDLSRELVAISDVLRLSDRIKEQADGDCRAV